MSQEERGEYLGVSESAISRYEAGKQLADISKDLTKLSAMEPLRQRRDDDYQVIGKIIKMGDEEMTIYMTPPSERKELKIWQKEKYQGRLNTEDVQPFTAEELAEYLMLDGNEEKRRILEATGSILKASLTSRALTMEKSLAGFVLEKCLEEPDYEIRKRLVAYFRKLCKEAE